MNIGLHAQNMHNDCNRGYFRQITHMITRVFDFVSCCVPNFTASTENLQFTLRAL